MAARVMSVIVATAFAAVTAVIAAKGASAATAVAAARGASAATAVTVVMGAIVTVTDAGTWGRNTSADGSVERSQRQHHTYTCKAADYRQ